MIEVILFDIDNTLLDFKKCAESSIRSAFKDWNLEYRPEYFNVFMEVNDFHWRQLEDGLITREQLYNRRWVDVFKRLGIEEDGVAFEKDFIKYLYQSHEKIEGAIELLEYLSSKYTLYITSNSSLEEQKGRLKASGMLKYFDRVFTSEDIGAAKPSPEFFDLVFKEIGSPEKEKVMIIGDNPNADIRGGNEYGIKTGWFNFLGLPEDTVQADIKTKDLLEFIELL